MRTRAALVAAATVSGLLVTPTSAAGVEPTCQGRPATIVASSKPGAVTNGTEGDDVIVGTSANIYALGGDDLVCLRNGAVASGDGDDTVLATGTDASGVSAYLGPGDDRYIGSPGSDYVRLADVAPDDHPVLDLGAGKDSLVMELHAGSSVQVQAGEGADDLVLTGDSSDYVFDLGTGEVTRAGVEVASLLGFESHDLSFGGTSGLRLLGTPGPDSLSLEAGRLDLHLGDGSDSLYLDWGSSRIPEAGAIDLGGGEDSLETVKAHLFVADLARGSLKLGAGGGHSGNLSLLGVERLRTVGFRVVLRGGPGTDVLAAFGCHIRVRGGAGPDHLAGRSSGIPGCGAHIAGGAGDDRLVGGGSPDLLVGGPGQDEALGGGGQDTCRAERETACER